MELKVDGPQPQLTRAENELNEFGRQGWEAVGEVRLQNAVAQQVSTPVLLLKRPLEARRKAALKLSEVIDSVESERASDVSRERRATVL